MLILSMLMKITGFTQEEFAKFIGVTRTTVNYWLNGEKMSLKSKKLIANKFNFPVIYFDVSLDENIETYKVIYATLYKNYNGINSKSNRIEEILNRIEFDDKTINTREITDDDILKGLKEGYDPFTGKVFDNDHILNNIKVKNILTKFIDNQEKGYEDLTDIQKEKYLKLDTWRNNKYELLNLKCASRVLSNKDLIKLATYKINDKNDLLKIKGFGIKKYNMYSDELIEILRG